MFDKFGEFDSAEEINRAAAAQMAEGDLNAVYAIAEENGIDREDAQDYIDGACLQLVNPLMAAYGKINIESAELNPKGIMNDWIDYIKARCGEDRKTAVAVRKKGKSLKGCVAALLCWSFKNQKEIDPEILRAAGVSGRVTLGIPDMRRAKQIITEYYTGEGNAQ